MSTTQVPVTTDVELTTANQRFGLTEVHLGDNQVTAAEIVAKQYNPEPRCESRGVSLANTRKAFNLDVCEYKPEAAAGVMLNGAPIVRVVTYFLDEVLVRLDVDAEGDVSSHTGVMSLLKSQWTDTVDRPLNATERTETVWMSGTDELAVSHHASASIVEYRIRDTRLADKLPWLFE